MKKGTNTKKKKNNEYIYIGKRTFTVFEAPSGNKYIQAKFGTKPDGKPLIKKITAPTRQELEQAIKDYIAEIEGIGGANITYYNAAMTYIETRQGLEFSTRTNYDRTARLRFKCLHSIPIHKPSTKTEASTRKILIDRRLYDMIHAQPHKSDDEFIIKETYPTYCNHIKAVMKDNGHPELTPHKLRHIFKSDNKRDNVVAIAVGGWCSGTNADGGDRSENGVSETVYTHVRQCEMDELMEKYSKKLLDAFYGTAVSAVRITVSRMVG